uniref:Uncharacterized protein n=1 Tax=Tanacetum cinerariifolium TaxID=118510 RepID=A0A699J160_TANCI|nr:hypothetical protein [Tanacetum cinerariifolium]
MASAVICLSTGRKFNFSKVDTPLFEGMIVAQQDNDVANEGAASVAVDDVPAAVDESFIPSPTPPTQPPPSQDLPSTSQVQPTLPPSLIAQPPSPQQQPQSSYDAEMSMDLLYTLLDAWGIIADIDADVDVTLKVVAAIAKEVEVEKTTEIEEITAASATITAADTLIFAAAITAAPSAARRRKRVVIRDPKETATPSTIIHTEPKSNDKGKGIMVHKPKPLKKKTQIEQDEAYARKLEVELNKNIDWDEVIEQVQRKEKEDNAVMRYQALKRKPQTEAQAIKNMMIYLRNMAGFKMDYFKGMTYDDIRPIFEKKFNSNVAFLEKTREQMKEEDNKALKIMSESQAEKVAKKQKLDGEVEELRKHLQIVPNDDDDVYTEATPLALKVPIVDYEIYTENNKPYYKIKRADGTHQLYLSFLSMLRNFDREDLEVIWNLVKERFVSLKPKNFSDDFLLTTLGAMFEKPDV